MKSEFSSNRDSLALTNIDSASLSKVVPASPTRMTGPYPLSAPGKLLLASSETIKLHLGITPELANSLAPTNPTSSAQVKIP